MSSEYFVKIIGSSSQSLAQALGTDTLPINPPIPVISPEGPAFKLDFNMLTNKQRRSLTNLLSREKSLPAQKVEEFLTQRGLGISVKDCVMRHVTQHQIDLMRNVFKQNVVKSYDGKIKKDAVSESFWLSIMIISFILGDEWRTRNITDNLFTNENRMEYLHLNLETEQDRYEHQFRFTLFADSLFRLQYSEGFELKIEELQQVSPRNPEVRLEDLAIELQIASMLVRSGHEVKFIERSGVERQDFDIEIKFKKTASIFAEIKCKRDETAVNVNNLRRTFYIAEKQLPSNSPNIVFVRIPTSWFEYEKLLPEVNRTTQNFYRNVPHINAIVFMWEEWFEIKSNGRGSVLNFKIDLHPSPQHPFDNLNELLIPQQIPSSIKSTFLEFSFGKFTD